jgi:hypothetical protein
VVESRPEVREDCEESILGEEAEEGEGSVWVLDKVESDRGPISRLVSVDDSVLVPQELVEEREVRLCSSSLCQGGFSWSSTAGAAMV